MSYNRRVIAVSVTEDKNRREKSTRGRYASVRKSIIMGSGSSRKAKSMSQDLRGKHFVVTGANTGIGYVTARELAKIGAKVTLACRSADKGQQAIDRLREEALAMPVEEVRASLLQYLPLSLCMTRYLMNSVVLVFLLE